MNRFMIAGTSSGCGKTTVTSAILSAFALRGASAASFKCGPDYIDGMFHREVTGIQARNLDPYFCGGAALREQFAKGMGRDVSVIEGAMGYYDGIGPSAEASAYTVARETKTPVVLVLDCHGAGNSIGAVISGFLSYKEDSGIKAVIFNNTPAARYGVLERVAMGSGVKALGFLPRDDDFSFPGRCLGLVAAGEVENLRAKLLCLGESALKTIDIESLLCLSHSAPPLPMPPTKPPRNQNHVRIAVARDEAFCFRYEENMEMLQEFGAKIVYFSPIHDAFLPKNIWGLYLCGGYPEHHLKALSSNQSMLRDIRKAVIGGMPAIAECGGFLLLHEHLDGFPMAGAISGRGFQTSNLRRFGYAELVARWDNLICAAGGTIRARSFHYWDSDTPGDAFIATKAGAAAPSNPLEQGKYYCAHATDALYAGFPYLYFPGAPEIPRRFVQKAVEFQ